MNTTARLTSTLAAILSASAGAIAAAGEPTTTVTTSATRIEAAAKEVNYSDLNLNHSKGVTALYGRISRAAESVCAPINPGAPQNAARARDCEEQSIARAVAEVNAPMLSSYHAKRAGTPPTSVASVASPARNR